MNMAVNQAEFAIPVFDGPQPRAFVPMRHPDRAPLRYQFFKAWQAFVRFKDDKEQTSVAFCVFDALPWIDIDLAAERFLATPHGPDGLQLGRALI